MVEVAHYYSHGYTVYNHSFGAVLPAVQHCTGAVQRDIAATLVEHLQLALGEINSDLVVLHVLGETVMMVEGSEVVERELHGAETLVVKLQ